MAEWRTPPPCSSPKYLRGCCCGGGDFLTVPGVFSHTNLCNEKWPARLVVLHLTTSVTTTSVWRVNCEDRKVRGVNDFKNSAVRRVAAAAAPLRQLRSARASQQVSAHSSDILVEHDDTTSTTVLLIFASSVAPECDESVSHPHPSCCRSCCCYCCRSCCCFCCCYCCSYCCSYCCRFIWLPKSSHISCSAFPCTRISEAAFRDLYLH